MKNIKYLFVIVLLVCITTGCNSKTIEKTNNNVEESVNSELEIKEARP